VVTVLALLTSILLGTGALVWGYAGVGLHQLARWIAVLGAVWLLAVWRRWRWFAYVGLAVYFLAAALGLWFLNFPAGWMFAGAICALLAWDLTFFRYRQRFAASEAERRSVETRHLLRLSMLAILGFALASWAMILQLQFGFDWVVFLAIVVAFGVSQIIRWFRGRA
jgi:hypothetical protein